MNFSLLKDSLLIDWTCSGQQRGVIWLCTSHIMFYPWVGTACSCLGFIWRSQTAVNKRTEDWTYCGGMWGFKPPPPPEPLSRKLLIGDSFNYFLKLNNFGFPSWLPVKNPCRILHCWKRRAYMLAYHKSLQIHNSLEACEKDKTRCFGLLKTAFQLIYSEVPSLFEWVAEWCDLLNLHFSVRFVHVFLIILTWKIPFLHFF